MWITWWKSVEKNLTLTHKMLGYGDDTDSGTFQAAFPNARLDGIPEKPGSGKHKDGINVNALAFNVPNHFLEFWPVIIGSGCTFFPINFNNIMLALEAILLQLPNLVRDAQVFFSLSDG